MWTPQHSPASKRHPSGMILPGTKEFEEYRALTNSGMSGISGMVGAAVKLSYDALVLSESGIQNYWPLNEAASAPTAIDAKGSRNGTNTGVTTGSTGLLTDGSTCYTFAGGTGKIDLGVGSLAYGAGTAGEGICTLELWCNLSAQTLLGYLFACSGSTDDVNIGTNLFLGGFGVGTNKQLQVGGTNTSFLPALSTTYHIVMIDAGIAGASTLYVNNVLTNSVGTGATGIASVAQAIIGKPHNSGNGFTWSGKIQKVAWYNVAKTSGMVSAHYTAGTT